MIDISRIWIPLLLTLVAGLSTVVGSLIGCCVTNFKQRYLHFGLGLSAGVMVYVAFVELLGSAVFELGFAIANLAFFLGILFIMLIDFYIPHQYIEEKIQVKEKRLMRAGIFAAIGVAIHNFPEGLAVFVSSFSDLSLGISLAFAIALHNIPEGIAITMPVYFATRSKKKAIWYSFLAGIFEPLAAVIAALFLLPYLTPMVVTFILAFVAGIMVFISFDELLPLTYKKEQNHVSIFGLILGMFIMAVSLYFL